ncbi:hypothetical protein DMENIID0001_038680 [Sergentomyia squamirostris]
MKLFSVTFFLCVPLIWGAPDDFVKVDLEDKTLYLSKIKRNFYEAMEACKAEGLILASLEKPKQSDQFTDKGCEAIGITTEQRKVIVWLGLYRFEDGSFRYLDGFRAPSFFKWNYNEPNNWGTEWCVSAECHLGKWFTMGCKQNLHFACQSPIGFMDALPGAPQEGIPKAQSEE